MPKLPHHDCGEIQEFTYPGFKDFAAMVLEHARLKNHPNVLASTQKNNHMQKTQNNRPRPPYRSTDTDTDRRVLKLNMENETVPRKDSGGEKYCPFHQRGHLLSECNTFKNQALEAKNDCILKASKMQIKWMFGSGEMCVGITATQYYSTEISLK